MEMMPFSEMMKLMDKKDHTGMPVPFSLKVVQLDRNRKSGGDILVVENAVISRNKAHNTTTASPRKSSPRHYENSTRNIKLIPSGQIRSIHPRLIIEFNNKPVFY